MPSNGEILDRRPLVLDARRALDPVTWGAPHQCADTHRIERHEAGPRRGEDGRVGAIESRLGICGDGGDPCQHSGALVGSIRVTGAHLGTRRMQQARDVDGARFAQVVGLGLEREPKDRHPRPRQLQPRAQQGQDALRAVVGKVGAAGKAKLRVLGHTDSQGSSAANAKLSEDRARAVVTFLGSLQGLEGVPMDGKGYGEKRPVALNDTPEGRQKNRRVDVLVIPLP